MLGTDCTRVWIQPSAYSSGVSLNHSAHWKKGATSLIFLLYGSMLNVRDKFKQEPLEAFILGASSLRVGQEHWGPRETESWELDSDHWGENPYLGSRMWHTIQETLWKKEEALAWRCIAKIIENGQKSRWLLGWLPVMHSARLGPLKRVLKT